MTRDPSPLAIVFFGALLLVALYRLLGPLF